MNIYTAKIERIMKLKNEMWINAGRPEPGTTAYKNLFPNALNKKPHYVLKGGKWWAFRSIHHRKKYIDALKNGIYDGRLYEPRPTIKTECGVM